MAAPGPVSGAPPSRASSDTPETRLQFLLSVPPPSCTPSEPPTDVASISASEASLSLLKSRSQIEQLQQALGSPLRNNETESRTPVPAPKAPRAPKATLLALFPPEQLLTKSNTSTTTTDSKKHKSKFYISQPFKTTQVFSDYKDFASAVHPTAPRVPAPTSPSIKSPPSTVRGPKGVSHPQLKELLQQSKAKHQQLLQQQTSVNIKQSSTQTYSSAIIKQSSSQTDSSVSSEQTKVLPSQGNGTNHSNSENKGSGSDAASSTSSSSTDNHDAYAELVKELARHEALVAFCHRSGMPVHETAFLPQQPSPQRGSAAPWQQPWQRPSATAPTRDSEGYTTTDDEFDSVPLRRTLSSRQYEIDRAKLYDLRIRSFSPPPVLVTNRGNMSLINSTQLVEARRLGATADSLKHHMSPAVTSASPSIVAARSASPSLMTRSGSPSTMMRSGSPSTMAMQQLQQQHQQQLYQQQQYQQQQRSGAGTQQASMLQRSASPISLLAAPLPSHPRSASPLVRGSPMRVSVGPSPTRGRPPYHGVIYEEEGASDLPIMRRSFSLNSEQLREARRAKSATLPNQRTSVNGTLESPPKRVSFSSLPSSRQDNRNGAPPTPTRRPSSSDSVFLYSPLPMEAPDKPLPPVPEDHMTPQVGGRYEVQRTVTDSVSGLPSRWQGRDVESPSQFSTVPQQQRHHVSPESESGSEAGEIQRILFKQPPPTYISFQQDDEWTSDGKSRGPPGNDQSAPPGGRDEDVRRGGGGSRNRRDEPRRHTLSGDQQGAGSAAGNLSRSMDLESATLQRSYYHQPAPISSTMFDDDPGIMSEVETASTGFRRGGKQRSSLPVVRTPSKTLERPLGLVFLQYRNETKRALLPNEITSIDTVKALFVRSFPKQLTMEYLDSPMVKIYIHDSSKDMFYELEDLRSHLRDIRDRSVLRLFETPDINGGAGGGVPVGGTPMPGSLPPHPSPAAWDQDQSYFSEPEFDSEYQHQHIHKTKGSGKGGSSPYYMAHSYPPGQPGGGSGSSTLPRGAPPVIRAYSPATKPVSQAGTGVTPPPAKPQRTYQEIRREAEIRPSSAHPPHSSPSSPSSNQTRPQSTPPRPPERWAYLGRSREPYSDRLHSESGYMSSPERGRPPYTAYPAAGAYEDPYYSQYGPRSGSITPVIDEEASDSDELLMDSYSIYGSKVVGGSSTARIQQPSPRPFPATGNIASQSAAALVPYDATRIRVEHMERQLANLTGLVQKALTQGSSVVGPGPRDFLQIPANQRDAYRNDDYDKHSSSSSASLPDETYLRAETTTTTLTTKPPKLGKDKSVSFEKSVSFSDDPPDMLSSPKQHTPQHSADTKPTKPAIKSSTLPRTSSQERDRHKPAPPPKPISLSSQHPGQYDSSRHLYRADLQLTPEMYNHLRVLQKKAKDLRQEVRNLRRMSQAQAHSVRETIRDTFIKIRAMLLTGGGDSWLASGDSEKLRVSREEELYKQEMIRLEKDLTELESTVEELRGNVINKKTRVNMSDVENMALVLSKSSKTVADLKVRFPSLQDGMKSLLSSEMEKVVREEKFLKEEPERLESALRRCKKLTGTLVTLKRLASVQEQRLPIVPSNNIQDQQNQRLSPDTLLQEPALSQQSGAISPQSKSSGDGCSPASSSSTVSARSLMAAAGTGSGGETSKRQENALDTLLDELQTFARPPSDRHGSIDASTPSQSSNSGTLRRLHSYPSSDSSSPVRSTPLARLQVSDDSKPPSLPERSKVPPPPPPRTSSRSPLVSPTSPPRVGPRQSTGGTLLRRKREPPSEQDSNNKPLSSNSSSSESINSQEGLRGSEALEQRHQELLRRQRQLQEQYARLQQLQRNVRLPPAPELKKTGSESNLLRGLNLSAAPTSGSLTHLAPSSIVPISLPGSQHTSSNPSASSKIYETDIL